MKKSLLFLLLIIPAICFSSSNYLDGDVVEEIKALEKQIKECEATVKALLPELKATLDGESFDIGVFKDMEIAEACLQKNINDLNILKELYPNLFKTLTASIYQENPNAMLAMMQFQSAIGGLYNQIITSYNLFARKMNNIQNKGSSHSSGSSEQIMSESASDAAAVSSTLNASAPATEGNDDNKDHQEYPIVRSKNLVLDLLAMAQKLIAHVKQFAPELGLAFEKEMEIITTMQTLDTAAKLAEFQNR